MLGNDYFYHQTIKKYVALFGSVFADVQIQRTDAQGNLVDIIDVPLSYSNKDKILAHMIQDPGLNRESEVTLPRLAFEMGNPYYENDRMLKGTQQRFAKIGTDADSVNQQFTPVPWSFPFNLYAFVKNAEDGTKIVEQIIPYFTPTLTFTEALIAPMGFEVDIPITLKNISIEDNYGGNFQGERRALIWTLSFEIKGWIYGPVRKKKLIKFVETNFFVDAGSVAADIDVSANDVVDSITVQPGLLANGSPTSNTAASVNVHTIFLDSTYGFCDTIT